jgi:hypothetical protein
MPVTIRELEQATKASWQRGLFTPAVVKQMTEMRFFTPPDLPSLVIPREVVRPLERAMSQVTLSYAQQMQRMAAEIMAPLREQMNEVMRKTAPLAAQVLRASQEYAQRVAQPLRAWLRQVPYVLADHALEAALEEDYEAVASFIRRCLRIGVNRSKIDAVIMALFEQTWTHVPPEEVMTHLKDRARFWYHNGSKSVWEHQIHGAPVVSLHGYRKDGVVPADVATRQEDPLEGFADQLVSSDVIQRVAHRLSPKERRVLLRRGLAGSWSEAARAEGLRPEAGDRLRRKISRWVEQGVIRDPRSQHTLDLG